MFNGLKRDPYPSINLKGGGLSHLTQEELQTGIYTVYGTCTVYSKVKKESIMFAAVWLE